MEATTLLRHEIKSVDEYYVKSNPESKYNSFSDLQRTAICGEVKVSKKMKNFSFLRPEARK